MIRSDLAVVIVLLFGSFLTGVAWAPAFGDASRVKGSFELLSFVATTVAAVVAVITLLAWKQQFSHVQKFESLKRFNKAVEGLYTSRAFIRSFMTLQIVKRRDPKAADIPKLELADKKSNDDWYAATNEFAAAHEDLMLYVDKKNLSGILQDSKSFASYCFGVKLKIVELSYGEQESWDTDVISFQLSSDIYIREMLADAKSNVMDLRKNL